ncbi:carboxylate/amino acid/amine transporter [Cobetia marina]|uniref:carboxylate/amino acid/amine transporter n=1 Tax=Cobetia marina TaxID=28258 RepID=UPI0025468DC0|nr:carboxylate/amino acid/amine transporter [Cobetia pacifica]MDI6002149.1 carboxylate/amino acid/amine transporter [Cobetia pacifica]
MSYLIGVTALWAFSFSLIGVYLSGQVDSYLAVLTRIVLASLIFAPFLRPRAISGRIRWQLMAIGAVQLGLMYIFFYRSFLLLPVPEVLLFTIFTPIYITLLDDMMKRRLSPFYLLTAMVAVIGAAIIRYDGVTEGFWLGFAVVQGANLCFAIGQVAYRHLSPQLPEGVAHRHVFGWFYLGALALVVVMFLLFGNTDKLPSQPVHFVVLGWLGIVASGMGYFLWNKGATRVDAGTLAIMNNALVPAGLLVNLLIWNRDADLPRLALGGAVIVLALLINQFWARQREQRAREAQSVH